MTKGTDLKAGNFINNRGHVCRVLKIEYYNPDNQVKLIKLKLHDLGNGETVNDTFDVDNEFSMFEPSKKEMELLYKTENEFIFIDPENLEQLEVPQNMTGDNSDFLQEKMKVNVNYYNDIIASVDFPNIVELKIDATEDIERDNANSDLVKEAKLVNDHVIIVPAFIKVGDIVRVDLTSGEYIRRV